MGGGEPHQGGLTMASADHLVGTRVMTGKQKIKVTKKSGGRRILDIHLLSSLKRWLAGDEGALKTTKRP